MTRIEKLKKQRQDMNRTMTSASSLIGVSTGAWSRWESGKRPVPSWAVIAVIGAKVLLSIGYSEEDIRNLIN